MIRMWWNGARGRLDSLWAESGSFGSPDMSFALLADGGLRLASLGALSGTGAAPRPLTGSLQGPLGASAAAGAPLMAGQLSPNGGERFHVVFSAGAASIFGGDSKQLVTGTAGEASQLTSGTDDQLVIGGDTDGAVVLDGATSGFEQLILLGGASYAIVSGDAQVASGGTLIVSAMQLGALHGVSFDGSAERDGSFSFYGGAGADRFAGGEGDDLIYGLGGADRLSGGAGADRFGYTAASESTGSSFDTLLGFDFAEDRIDLPVEVKGFAAAIRSGTLSLQSFDKDLAAALTPAKLGAGQALFFTPDSGELAGKAFLVVDANGKAGYQAGEDFVIHFDSAPPADLSGAAFLV